MSVPTKLGAYAAVLALALVAGAGLGAAVGPIDIGGSDPAEAPDTTDATDTTDAIDRDEEIHDGGHGS